MENKLRMPESFGLMSEEELVYTAGGSVDGAVMALGLACATSVVNFVWAMPKLYKWAYENANDDRKAMVEQGVNELYDEMSKGFFHALTYGYTALNLTALWPVTLTILCIR